jgi:hypothetical protein
MTKMANDKTTEERQFVIERWLGEIQIYLEARIKDAPTESCAVFARNLWDETAEFDGDVGASGARGDAPD